MIDPSKLRRNELPVSILPEARKHEPVIVFFYAPLCGWCEKMKPDWKEFTKKSPIKFSEVSAGNMYNYDPSPDEESVRGYPTVRLYNKGKLVKEYDGDRSHKDILKFVNKHVKQKKANKKNLLLVRARKGNQINSNLIKKITKGKKKRSRRGTKKKRVGK